jgi:uncharacterized coiled-coil protein SlyX
MDTKTADNRIGELEEKLKQRDRTILELRQEAEESQALIAELREQVQDVGDIIDSWIEAFDMELGDDGIWNFSRYDADRDAEHEAYVTLVRKWNKLVPRYNAVIAANGLGRPLLASEAQQRDVRKLHKSGKSLRTIVTATGLTFRTVRTIVGRVEGTDRTTRRTNELRRLELNASRMAAYRARKRTRDALPKRITEALARGKSLVKRAR